MDLVIAAEVVAGVSLAGRIDDLRKLFPGIGDNAFEFFVENDFSPSKKYVKWMLQTVEDNGWNRITDKWPGVINVVQDFDRNRSKLVYKDIYKYEFDELRDELSRIKPSRKDLKAGGAKKIYSDGDWEVIRLDSREAAKTYGSGTQWCINVKQKPYDPTSGEENTDWWSRHRLEGSVFYMIVHKPTGSKWMFETDVWGGEEKIWDARDNQISEDELVEDFEEETNSLPDWASMESAIRTDRHTEEAGAPVYAEIERVESLDSAES